MKALLLSLTMLSVLFPVAAADFPLDEPLPDFRLQNQNGQSVTLNDLRGRVWVAGFIFTRCPGPCAQTTRHLLQIRETVNPRNGVEFVSFTVDPYFDSPEALRNYQEAFTEDPKQWQLLTGEEAPLRELIRQGFLQWVRESDGEDGGILHSTKFVLIDQNGHVRAFYDGTDVAAVKQAANDIRRLLQNPSPPPKS